MRISILEQDIDANVPCPARNQVRLVPGEQSRSTAVDRMSFWRPFAWKVADIVCGEGAMLGATPLHAHEAMQLLLPLSPVAVVAGGGDTVLLNAGSVHITSPLELCAMRGFDGAPFRARVMLLGPALLARAVGAPIANISLGVCGFVVQDAGVHAELTSLFEELARPLVDVECVSRLAMCLRRVLTQASSQPRAVSDILSRQPAGVVRARNYLRDRAVSPVTLDELAREAALSKFYLLRAFQRAFGLTPHSYQMQLRLARARRLIAEGRPLSHVTYDAGFADQSHLTRRFAAFYGLTPARFARQLAPTVGQTGTRAATAGWGWGSSSAA